MLIVEHTREIKKEILCFKSGEESIIENGPGVLDFKGRNIAQNVLTFIFTPEKNPFRESSQLIKKNCSKCANIHSHLFRESSQLIKSCISCDSQF